MTELEYVIAGFDEQFHTCKGRKIVLHGSREYAEGIIEHFESAYHFIGVMSKDPLEGEDFHGIKVLREEDIPLLDIDLIILTERVRYAEAVYASIGAVCREHGVRLYNMYGLDEHKVHDELGTCQYKDADEWEALCRPYDIVAFEVKDTFCSPAITKWFETPVRADFMRLVPRLLAAGKDVRLSLRKSFPEEEQIAVLRKSGLFSDLEQRLIRRRGEDLSFRMLAESNPGKRILYIGTGLVNECILPRCYGIDTYRYVELSFDCLAPEPDSEYIRAAYEENLKGQVLEAIREADLVSFDVFDTLIQRMTLEPVDVFRIVESRAAAKGLPADHFARERSAMEKELQLPTIGEIYDALGEKYRWSEEERKQMLDLELAAERQVIVPRTEVAELLQIAVAQGKTAVLTSDMYLPEPLLREILSENGIEGYSKLFVSCDVRKSKYDGLYENLFSLCSDAGKILHIGNDVRADGKCCEPYGIRSVILPSAHAMACAGSWRRSVECARSLMERCLIGMAVSELFRDPFRNPNLQEVESEERLRRFAAGVIGPLVTGYLTWLISRIRAGGIDKVLFFSRDGYLPEKIYRGIRLEPPLPGSVYFHANRHASFLTCADDPAAAGWIASVGKNSGLSGKDILKNIYGMDEKDIPAVREGETEEELILRCMPAIKGVAAAARRNYTTYMKKCGLKENERCAVVDFIATGSTQMYLERFLPLQLRGFYFGRYEASKINQCEIEYYLKGDNKILLGNYIELESYMSAPEPSVERIREDGSVAFQQEVRSRQDMEDLQFVLDRAEQYTRTFFTLFYEDGEVIRPALPEEMFAADGYHWVQKEAYEDWLKTRIEKRKWRNGGK